MYVLATFSKPGHTPKKGLKETYKPANHLSIAQFYPTFASPRTRKPTPRRHKKSNQQRRDFCKLHL